MIKFNKSTFTLAFTALFASCAQKNESLEIIDLQHTPIHAELGGVYNGVVPASEDPITKTTVFLYFKVGAICSGSIINDHQILTAKHCQELGEGTIVFSANPDRDLQAAQSPVQRAAFMRKIKSSVAMTNDGFTGDSVDNEDGSKLFLGADLALLNFDGGLPAGFKAAKIAINLKLEKGYQVNFAGYGLDEDSETGTLKKNPGVVMVADEENYRFYAPKGGVLSGDSGGPVYIVSKGEVVLVGVNSTASVALTKTKQGEQNPEEPKEEIVRWLNDFRNIAQYEGLKDTNIRFFSTSPIFSNTKVSSFLKTNVK